MRETNLRLLDLNLLVVMQALLAEQHVTRAAQRLDMSQPAVSRALKRLRELFDDPLLVRGSEGLVLTDRAAALRDPLERLLAEIDHMVSATGFDPATATGSIRIGCLDLEARIYLPRLVERVRRLAPGMDVEVYSHPDDFFTRLAEGRLHLAISGLEPARSDGQFHRRVIDHTWPECVMSSANPLAAAPLTVSGFLGARHGIVSITGEGPALMDERLRLMGRSRRVVVRLSSFFNVPDACAGTDILFSLPHRIAERLARDNDLCVRSLPPTLRGDGFPMYLYWHARHHADAMHRWLRQLVISQATETVADGTSI